MVVDCATLATTRAYMDEEEQRACRVAEENGDVAVRKGTGFFLTDGPSLFLVTAAHMVQDTLVDHPRRVPSKVLIRGAGTFTNCLPLANLDPGARWVLSGDEQDVAVLRLADSFRRSLSTGEKVIDRSELVSSQTAPRQSVPLKAFGHWRDAFATFEPKVAPGTQTSGEFFRSSLVRGKQNLVFDISAIITEKHGISGGPVMNESHTKCYGLVTGQQRDGDTAVTPAVYILRTLDDARRVSAPEAETRPPCEFEP